VQDRNEALCGTGFYTNIWQYKCTDLGDISDEGSAKGLSASEEGAADSLLSKLDLGDGLAGQQAPTDATSATPEEK